MSENKYSRDFSANTAQIREFQNLVGETSVAGELPLNAEVLTGTEHIEKLRIIEAVLFAASEPLDDVTLAERLPEGADVDGLVRELAAFYSTRGVNLVRVAGKWSFRTAEDLAFVMRREAIVVKRLSRPAVETLAIIAYHQPTTRAEIEDVRGVAVSKGTIDVLMEAGWVHIKGRRQTPGRPVTFGTTDEFLNYFGLESVKDLPGVDELKSAGLLRSEPPVGYDVLDGLEDDADRDGNVAIDLGEITED